MQQIAEAGERPATSDTQDVEVGSDNTEHHPELATHVASVCTGAFGASTVLISSLLAVFHSIARHVFQYKQTRVLQMKKLQYWLKWHHRPTVTTREGVEMRKQEWDWRCIKLVLWQEDVIGSMVKGNELQGCRCRCEKVQWNDVSVRWLNKQDWED